MRDLKAGPVKVPFLSFLVLLYRISELMICLDVFQILPLVMFTSISNRYFVKNKLSDLDIQSLSPLC